MAARIRTVAFNGIDVMAVDVQAQIASGADPRLVRGATIVGQFWSRDPASPTYPSGLTGGVRLTIGP